MSYNSSKFNVIRGVEEYSDSGELLFKYLMKLPEDRFYRRILRNADVKSLEDWEARAAEIREAFLEAIGGLPDKRTPLNARTVGVVEGEDYFIEKVIFESLSGFHVTANLYVPKNRKGRVPGILFPIGHWYSGKASPTNRYAATVLAKRGYVVLTYDTIGQGERYQAVNPRAKVYSDLPFDPAISLVSGRPNTLEHCLVGNQCFLAGINLARFVIWDGIRALDYLTSRPEVDGERIGCTGCSGGGTYTMYLTALDARIKVAVPVCAVTSIALGLNSDQSGDAEQVLVNAALNLLDHGDLLMMAFPRPVLIVREAKDYIRIGTRIAYYEAKTLYERLGYGDRIRLLEVDAPHGYYREMREPMYRWMDKWLLGIERESREPEIQLPDERIVCCTKTGQVLMEFNGRSVRDLVDEYVDQVKPRRKVPENEEEAGSFRAQLKKEIIEVLSLRQAERPVRVKSFGEIECYGYRVEKRLLYTEPDIYVPALFFKSDDSPKPAVLYVNTMGKALDAYRSGPIFRLLHEGFHVLSIDVRGTGETEPTRVNGYDRRGGYPQLLEGFKASLSYKALVLGKPIFGFQVFDVLSSLEYLLNRDDVKDDEVWLIGRHVGGMLVLHAGVLNNDKINGVIASDFLLSYRSMIRSIVYSWNFIELVPSVLSHYDLNELAAAMAPKNLLLTNLLNPLKKPASAEEVEDFYGFTKQTYSMLKAPEKIEVAASYCGDEGDLQEMWVDFMVKNK